MYMLWQKSLSIFGVLLFFITFVFVMNNKEKFCAFWATGFGVGFWPWGPGTAGALFATLMWIIYGSFVAESTLFFTNIAAIILATVIGTITTNKLERVWGEDPKKVVIDEMIGVWIPLTACTMENMWYVALSFVLFRFFDIVKPLGIRSLDRRHGGFWVMADDILAGIYSLIIIIVLQWLCQ